MENAEEGEQLIGDNIIEQGENLVGEDENLENQEPVMNLQQNNERNHEQRGMKKKNILLIIQCKCEQNK